STHLDASKGKRDGWKSSKSRRDACVGKRTVGSMNRDEEITMNSYQTLIPRVAFGIAAVAMTAITIGVSVVMPARMDSDSPEPRMLDALTVTAPASTGDVTGSESI